MSEVNYASGTGVCSKCGQQLLQLENDGSKLCVMCKSKRLVEGGLQVPQVKTSEEQVNKVLAAAGISVKPGLGTPQAPTISPTSTPAPVLLVSFEDMINSALTTMKNLPMPKDVKQFKTISKIISQMEGLIGSK